MTTAVAGLVPLLASTSKVPYYVAAGVLVVWAIVLAVVGIRSPDFPGASGLGRGVLGVSALLVAGVMVTAVITASKPAKAHEAAASAPKPAATTAPAATAPATQPSAAAPASGTVALAADKTGQLKYDTGTLSAKAGRVTVDFTNASPVPHNVTIQRGGRTVAATKTFAQGKASVSTALTPGAYTFLCTVDSHAQAGMKGTLTVK